MTVGGWISMCISVGAVVSLFVWCIVKVIRTPNETGKVHGFEFETPDEKAEREEDEK